MTRRDDDLNQLVEDELNVLLPDGGMLPPAGSRLADRADYITDQKLDKVEALADWASKHGRTLLEVAIGGLAAQPGCASVIAGATSPEQVKANAAAGEWEPAQEALAEIDAIVPVFG